MINGESPNAQDARVEELWRRLGGDGKGYLDLPGLKKGLRKMDHRKFCPEEGVMLEVPGIRSSPVNSSQERDDASWGCPQGH
jgi:hypothetical protein